jgi:hypothetical protein
MYYILQATSPTDLLERLRDTGTLDVSARVQQFSTELYNRIPHPLSASAAAKARIDEQKSKEMQVCFCLSLISCYNLNWNANFIKHFENIVTR